MNKIKIMLDWFVPEMHQQLMANQHKGRWDKCSLEYLSSEITRNHGLLLQLIADAREEEDPQCKILKRCANIANYAMMIASNICNVEEDADE